MTMNLATASTILIVEDEIFIAMDLEQCLGDFGYEEIFVATSCSQAHLWLEANTPAAAILDISLKDGSCAALAGTLADRQVPFIVSSGMSEQAAEEVFRLGRWLSKPYQPEALHEALLGLNVVPSRTKRAAQAS
jgi:DNA-binding response OmpR family regulator